MSNTILVDGQEFRLIATESESGEIVRETYFATDRSYIRVEIDYTYTTKGYK